MSEVVVSLRWAQVCTLPEQLLQAFFLTTKGVWGMHLLTQSVHPLLPIVCTECGTWFDPRFMEDAIVGCTGRLEPASMKMIVIIFCTDKYQGRQDRVIPVP
jgi:hypothetical protein